MLSSAVRVFVNFSRCMDCRHRAGGAEKGFTDPGAGVPEPLPGGSNQQMLLFNKDSNIISNFFPD